MKRLEAPNAQAGSCPPVLQPKYNLRTNPYLCTTVCLVIVFFGTAVPEAVAEESSEKPFVEPYISAFFMRSEPTYGRYKYLEDSIPSVTVGSGSGGGFKVGGYARPYNYAFGLELEGFAHGGKLSAPRTTVGGVPRSANQDFTMVNMMLNVLARYKGDFIQPYAGGGVGLTGVFTDGMAQSAGGTQSGLHGLTGLAMQAIAGARVTLTQHVYAFAEYKYLVSSSELDNCGDERDKPGNTCRILNELTYQSHYATVGVGFNFW